MKFPAPLPISDASSLSSDDQILIEMAEEAVEYASRFHWVRSIISARIEFCIPNVIVVLFVTIVPNDEGIDRELWVISGDLPIAYLVTDRVDNAGDAMDVYCDLMDDWVGAVKSGRNLHEVFPVEAESNEENANLLRERIKFIREDIIPDWHVIE